MNAVRASVRALARLVRRLGEAIFEGGSSRQPSSGGAELAARERLIRRILSTIHNNSILLCGGPGSGKTSILLHLKERLAASEDTATEFFPVYIDLHDVPERLLFATVAGAVTEQLAPVQLLFRMHPTAGSGRDYSHRDLANDLRRVIRCLQDRSFKQTRLVLLVDGVDELNKYDPRTTQRVRSLFMANITKNLVMVASAVEIDKRWEQEGSPWYNFFEEIELPPVNRERRRPG